MSLDELIELGRQAAIDQSLENQTLPCRTFTLPLRPAINPSAFFASRLKRIDTSKIGIRGLAQAPSKPQYQLKAWPSPPQDHHVLSTTAKLQPLNSPAPAMFNNEKKPPPSKKKVVAVRAPAKSATMKPMAPKSDAAVPRTTAIADASASTNDMISREGANNEDLMDRTALNDADVKDWLELTGFFDELKRALRLTLHRKTKFR